MVIAEVGYLLEKGRIELSLSEVERYLSEQNTFTIYPQTLEVLKATFAIEDIPELHDRIIAGTARLLEVPLITNDQKIESSTAVETVWS